MSFLLFHVRMREASWSAAALRRFIGTKHNYFQLRACPANRGQNWWMPSYISPMLNITAITSTNNGVRLTWATSPGQSYVLQAASQWGGPNRFSDISSPISARGTGVSLTNFTDTNEWTGTATRYYRVRLAP